MNDLPHISEVTSETFQSLVIDRSAQVPVLVDFWADWCGPCQMQMPVLQKLVTDYDGKFVLAKVNTDEQRELASANNIRSLPTMRIYRNGAVVEEILGAQTEGTLRVLLDRYIERPSDAHRTRARELFAAGDQAQALALLEEARQAEPDNHQLTLEYAGLNFRAGRTDVARELLDKLPRDIREEPEGRRLDALLDFAAAAPAGQSIAELQAAADAEPQDSERRYRLGCASVLQAQYEQAQEAFMHILTHDRNYHDDAARKALLALFSLLGDDDERVAAWRRRMFNALH